MDLIAEGIYKAFVLLLTLDPEVLRITLLSLSVSGAATLISLILGISLGIFIALKEFAGKKFVISTINTGMGLPPVVVGLFVSIFLWRNLRYQILALGATRLQMMWLLIREARLPLLAAVMAGFGGVISEVGASIMVGGNIKGYTRVLTTATVMETSRGNFDIAIALSIILMVLAFVINAILTYVQQRERPR